MWDVYRDATGRSSTPEEQVSAVVCNTNLDRLGYQMLTKLWHNTEFYVVAYSHQGCHRTTNAVDRPMNRLAD